MRRGRSGTSGGGSRHSGSGGGFGLNSGGHPREMKVVLLGETGVGKSSIVARFAENTFRPFNAATVGASFLAKTIDIDGISIKFQIWDTAGQEKYHSLAPMYYRGAAAAIIVYDISNSDSFGTLKSWVDELANKGPADITIVVAGNKCDLEGRRKVTSEEASSYAREIDALFIETSAKTSVNVTELFEKLAKKVPRSKLTKRLPPTPMRVTSGAGTPMMPNHRFKQDGTRCGNGGCC